LSDEELAEAYDFALDLARRAGQILLDGVAQRCGQDTAGRRQGEKEKDSSVDIVTQTDLGAFIIIAKPRNSPFGRCGSSNKRCKIWEGGGGRPGPHDERLDNEAEEVALMF
jgi:hypothetical protein